MFGKTIFSRPRAKTLALLCLGGILASAPLMQSALAQRSTYTYLSSDWVSIGPQQSSTLRWRCPSDRNTVGGGFETQAVSGNSADGFKVIHSFPEDSRTWKLRLRNTDDIARNVKIYNICSAKGAGQNPDPGDPTPGDPTPVDPEDLPPWIELSDNARVIVDFTTMPDDQLFKITLPIGALPDSVFNNDGTLSIPDNFCGLRVRQAETFTWQTMTNIVIDDPPYMQSDNINQDFGTVPYLGGISFSGPIGDCEEENDPWQFNFPLTQNSGDSPIPNLRLVIEVIPGSSEIEFLFSN
ncbi:MAG: hypothetical protein KTR27_03970 [Leptolyngbyaceae cyanobacterium MAG.088]|nr:hypothetical protein [Leptolyngbyaceae cyanobacterium MAG.088]